MLPYRPFYQCLAGLSALLLVGCASPAPEPRHDPLAVLGMPTSLVTGPGGKGWEVLGRVSEDQSRLTTAFYQGIPGLRIRAATEPLTAIRRTQTRLLTTPYLSWSWLLSDSADQDHPVRVVIGFSGGSDREAKASSSAPDGWTAPALPPHDRMIALMFGRSALQRGYALPMIEDKNGQTPSLGRYIVRGGSEQTGTWWVETVDLSGLYRRFWPKDDPASVRIAFVGISAGSSAQSREALISGLMLSR